jgi:hypothetical protein
MTIEIDVYGSVGTSVKTLGLDDNGPQVFTVGHGDGGGGGEGEGGQLVGGRGQPHFTQPSPPDLENGTELLSAPPVCGGRGTPHRYTPSPTPPPPTPVSDSHKD